MPAKLRCAQRKAVMRRVKVLASRNLSGEDWRRNGRRQPPTPRSTKRFRHGRHTTNRGDDFDFGWGLMIRQEVVYFKNFCAPRANTVYEFFLFLFFFNDCEYIDYCLTVEL